MYHFDEGAFELPPGYKDRTIHVFEARHPGGGEMITMTREPMPEGKTLGELVDEYLTQTATRLRRFELGSSEKIVVGLLPAALVRFDWFHAEKGAIFQQQAFINHDGTLLCMTMTVQAKDRKRATKNLADLLQTVKLRRR